MLMWRKARGLCQSLDSSPGSAATRVTLAQSVLLASISYLQAKSRNWGSPRVFDSSRVM